MNTATYVSAKQLSRAELLHTILRLKAQVEAARIIIMRANDLMTPDQVGQWEGVRSWLEQDETDYYP
jgi:hypothetical protein